MLGGIFCLFATQTVALVLIPLVAADFDLPGIVIGLLVGVPAGLGLMTDVPVADASDRVGRRLPMLLGAGLGLLAGVLIAFADSLARLVLGVLAFGLSFSLSAGPALAYVTEACRPEDHARVQGYNGGVQGLSALGGAALIALAVERFGPERSALLVTGLMALALVLFLPLHETVRSGWSARDHSLPASYVRVLRLLATRPQLQLAGLIGLVFGAVVMVVGNAFVPLYIVRELDRSAVLAGSLLTARNIAMTLTSPLFGVSVARYGLVPTLLGANAVAVAGVLAMAVFHDPLVLVAPLLLQGAGIGFAAATANVLVTSATRRHERALGFAATSLVARAGSLSSPIIFGAVLDAAGMPAVFLTAGVLGVLCVIAMAVRTLTTDETNRHRWERELSSE